MEFFSQSRFGFNGNPHVNCSSNYKSNKHIFQNDSSQYWSSKSPVIAGRKGSPVTSVLLSGKGTLSIWGVIQFKDLQSKDISVKWGFKFKVSIKYNSELHICTFVFMDYRIRLWSARSFCSSSQLSWQKTHLCNRVIINFSTCSIMQVTCASGKAENKMKYTNK